MPPGEDDSSDSDSVGTNNAMIIEGTDIEPDWTGSFESAHAQWPGSSVGSQPSFTHRYSVGHTFEPSSVSSSYGSATMGAQSYSTPAYRNNYNDRHWQPHYQGRNSTGGFQEALLPVEPQPSQSVPQRSLLTSMLQQRAPVNPLQAARLPLQTQHTKPPPSRGTLVSPRKHIPVSNTAPHSPNIHPSFFPSRSISTTDVSTTSVSITTSAQSSRTAPRNDNLSQQSVPRFQTPSTNAPFFSPTATPPLGSKLSSHVESVPSLQSSRRQSLETFPIFEPNILSDLPRPLKLRSFEFVNANVEDVLDMITLVLSNIVEKNDRLLEPQYINSQEDIRASTLQNIFAGFHGCNIPAITLDAYLARILKYCPTTVDVFISMLVYFDRIATNAANIIARMSSAPGAQSATMAVGSFHTLLKLDSYNVHRLIISAITVASKFFSDIFYKNSRYAKVGGLPLEELNHLEIQFLLLTNFNLMVSVEEMQTYADFLLNYRAERSS